MFAAPWLARRVGCQVVVTVRDPVATVSSWRRLGWTPRLAEISGLEVVRHEDLSADPVPSFAALYGRLGLPFGPEAERAIVAATSAGSGGGAMRWSVSAGLVSKTAARRLDSRANLQVWR